MTHIFIVNEQTFNIHLEYLFAGIGYSDFEPQLKNKSPAEYEAEKTLTGMIADISRVRVGDSVIFYVTGCRKLFGIFQIDSRPFFSGTNYLDNELGKCLPIRVRIKPYLVYANGISEQLALDEIENIDHPYQMCWSLIYRKLAAKRGCSYITDSEALRLFNLLRKENNYKTIDSLSLNYDMVTQKIKSSMAKRLQYSEKTDECLDIDMRLFNKYGSFEGHLQAYIMQNFDIHPLKNLLLPDDCIDVWVGNEVICSVGERRIDILLIAETDTDIYIRIIELKDEKPTSWIITAQFPWYIKWVEQYIVPNLIYKNKRIRIIPTVIADAYKRKCSNKFKFDSAMDNYNLYKPIVEKNCQLEKMEYISFIRTNHSIEFDKQ